MGARASVDLGHFEPETALNTQLNRCAPILEYTAPPTRRDLSVHFRLEGQHALRHPGPRRASYA